MGSNKQGVYRLETYRFDSKYSRFMRSNPKTFPEFYPRQYDEVIWTAPRLAATWKPQKLIGKVWAENDFPGENAPAFLTPIFSPRAVEGLREFLEPNGELLPVLTPLGTYFAYNVTRVVDVLDVRKSRVRWDIPKFRADEVDRFEFKAGVKGLTIFKIPQMPLQIYVAEPFVQRVRELGLKGMWITKCWPMPKGVNWHEAWEAELERMKRGENKPRQGPILPEKPPKRVGPPKILDLRRDVVELMGLPRRVMKWVKSNQKKWAAGGEFVTGIGLESMGWDVDGGPGVMCHVDTRDEHEWDGDWSYFQVATMWRPKWSALANAILDSETERVLIDVRGMKHALRGDDDRLSKWFGEAMVEALKMGRERGLFKGLLKARECWLGVEDTDTGFGWPKGGTKGKDNRAG